MFSLFSAKKIFEKLSIIEHKIDMLSSAIDDKSAIDSRTRILRFGDEIGNGINHTQEHFNQILCEIDRYENYCQNNPDFRNFVSFVTIKQIRKEYEKRMTTGDFLKGIDVNADKLESKT